MWLHDPFLHSWCNYSWIQCHVGFVWIFILCIHAHISHVTSRRWLFISLLPLLSSYILSALLSSKLHKPRRDDLDIAFKAENLTIILFSQHWLCIHVCIKCCQSQTEAFLTKDESRTLYTYKGHIKDTFQGSFTTHENYKYPSPGVLFHVF